MSLGHPNRSADLSAQRIDHDILLIKLQHDIRQPPRFLPLQRLSCRTPTLLQLLLSAARERLLDDGG